MGIFRGKKNNIIMINIVGEDLDSIQAEELTEKETEYYEARADELAKQYNVSKVHPIVTIDFDTQERHVCYLKEPLYDTKIRVLDKVQQIGAFSAGEELRRACVLTKESDPVTYGDTPECDRYKMCAVDEAMSMIRKFQNQFKKKSKKQK